MVIELVLGRGGGDISDVVVKWCSWDRGYFVNVYFDVKELYYLPQYMPIQDALLRRGASVTFVMYGKEGVGIGDRMPKDVVVRWVKGEQEARAIYLESKPDWLIIANNFNGLEDVHQNTKTALVSHGIGPKACYYSVSDSATSVRFVEGPYRTRRLQNMYPSQTFYDTGYAKLDPVVNGDLRELRPSEWGLDDTKKTILYAPTFYPSSIECMSKDFPREFEEYNVILKPHYFSLVNIKYENQKKLLDSWARYDNVYLAGIADINIVPFLAVSDVLISDASSTLFEFAALNKPVIWCDFYKLRWGYRGLFKYRFKKRMDEDLYKYADIAIHAKSYSDLKRCVDNQIEVPESYAKSRRRFTSSLAGKVDGRCSERIVDYIMMRGEVI